jgi:CRISPR-associated protein Csm1
MGNINREELYLGALLEHIPVIAIQKTFNNINGIEAILRKANQYASANQYKKGDKQDYVLSPFENLKKANLKKANMTADYKFKPQVLNLSDAFFPKKGNVVDSKGINGLWNQFEQEFDRLAVQQNLTYRAETTLSLLEKNTVTIPNPTAIHPEVSWYDYTKIKAGLAVCIHDYLDANNKTEINNDENPLLIIRADISGIQDFINNIASKNASKNLKGRSFYVQLLVDTVLKLMLKKLNLFEGNVMYASGGNFFVIAPNTEFVKDAFREFEEEVTAAIFAEHKTRISVVMGSYIVSEAQILNGKIDEAIVALFTKVIDKKKKQKFSVLIKNDYDMFFEPSDNGGKVVLDAITGEEIDTKRAYKIDKSIPEKVLVKGTDIEDNIVKKATASQIILGRCLKDLDYIIISEEKAKLIAASQYVINPCKLGIYYYLIINDENARKEIEKGVEGLESYEIVTINALNSNSNDFTIEFKALNKIMDTKLSFQFYGGDDMPRFNTDFYDKLEPKNYKKGDLKTFNQLAYKIDTKGEGVGSFKRLGVLKMDIDSLGSIFKNDVIRPNLTFSYYATLSRNLDWFFKGYLNTLWQTKNDFKESTQIIYSGGDDLFIVGRWDAVIEFAKTIKEKFASFTKTGSKDRNEQITISGGVSIVTEKFPIMKAAKMAGDAEHKAKQHRLFVEDGELTEEQRNYNFKKNSVTLLGVPLHWDSEYPLVEELKNELVRYVSIDSNSKKGLPKSILGKIKSHYFMMMEYEDLKDRGEYANPRWIWMVVYDFSRFKQRQREDHKQFVERLQVEANTGNKNKLKHLQEAEKSKAKEDFLSNLQKGIFSNSYENSKGETYKIISKLNFLELLYVASRWAELEMRSNQNH